MQQELIDAYYDDYYIRDYTYMRFQLSNISIHVNFIVNNIEDFAHKLFRTERSPHANNCRTERSPHANNCSTERTVNMTKGQIYDAHTNGIHVIVHGTVSEKLILNCSVEFNSPEINARLYCKSLTYAPNINWNNVATDLLYVKCSLNNIYDDKVIIPHIRRVYILHKESKADFLKLIYVFPNLKMCIKKHRKYSLCFVSDKYVDHERINHSVKYNNLIMFAIKNKDSKVVLNAVQ